MELKQTKVYVPTHEILKDGWVNLGQDKRQYVKIKEGYFLTKEELERVIGDAISFCWFETKKELPHLTYIQSDYIKQILK